MNWGQKLEALKALCGEFNVSLKMRAPGDWYVETTGLEIKVNASILSSHTSRAPSPEKAVEDAWRAYVEDLPPDRYLVVGAMRSSRRHVRWNGFMWQDLPVDGGL